MKILTVVMDLDFGGTQRAAQVFAEAYHELGNDSKILSLYGLGSRLVELKKEVIVYDGISFIENIKQWSPDLVHFHSTGLKEEDVFYIIDKIDNSLCKFVETNVFSEPTPWVSYLDQSFQLSTWANWIYQIRGGNPKKSKIVANPIKIESFQPASEIEIKSFKSSINIPDDSIVIGRIGQAFNGKWSSLLIHVFNELANIYGNLYLVIVNAPDEILSLVKSSEFNSRIRYIPKIIGDKPLSVAYSSMDAMLHIAEQGESFGIVLCECILSGTPVVTLSTPWNDNSQCEVVGHNRGGIIANTKKGIIIAVQSIIENKANIALDLRINEIREEYGHIKIAKTALNSLYDLKSRDDTNEIITILNDSIDKPSLITKFLLLTKNDYFRKMTKYSSGYDKFSKFISRRLARFKI